MFILLLYNAPSILPSADIKDKLQNLLKFTKFASDNLMGSWVYGQLYMERRYESKLPKRKNLKYEKA